MKTKHLDLQGTYESPVIAEVDIASEGILCASGNTIEDFNWLDDEDGWQI